MDDEMIDNYVRDFSSKAIRYIAAYATVSNSVYGYPNNTEETETSVRGQTKALGQQCSESLEKMR
jgi:hypothetical protein